MPVIDDDETLILEEVSRSKILAKQNDPISKEKKVNTTPINYVELNKLSEDFGKRFVPQQELSAEQAFWFHMSNPFTESSDASPVKVELPVNSLRTTPDALTEEYFKNNDLKAQLQDKDTTICKLKELIKSMRENNKEEKVNHDISELETINEELENRFESLNSRQGFVITSLKNDLQKLKGKEIVENAAQIPSATTIVPGMFTLDLDPLAPRITPTKVVPIKESTPHSVDTQKPELKVYSRRPKHVKTVGSSKKAKIVESKNANNSGPNHSWGSNATDVPSSFSLVNDRVYYVEGLGHNLFSVVKIFDTDLEVAFQKNTYFSRNLEGVDLLSGSRDTNLYTISLDDMLKTSLICLLSKASKTKSWLWHRRLSNLNFGTLNKLAKDDLARGIPKLKFQKDHMCSVRLNATICNVRTDNGTEFINQTLRDFYEYVGISHQTSVAHTPQQNDVVERQNQTLMEAARTMLIFSKAPLLGAQLMTPATSSSGIVQNPVYQQPCNSPNRYDWNRLFQSMFDKYFNPPPVVISLVPVAAAPRAVDLADSHVSTSIDQDAPSTSIPSTLEQDQSLIISQGVEESPKTPHFNDDPFHETLHEDSTSQGSSSNVRPSHTPFELLGR
ncbi:integrase, catalytic region, zinc finger, CCHC-type containing protein [Tanacetum coccineum]